MWGHRIRFFCIFLRSRRSGQPPVEFRGLPDTSVLQKSDADVTVSDQLEVNEKLSGLKGAIFLWFHRRTITTIKQFTVAKLFKIMTRSYLLEVGLCAQPFLRSCFTIVPSSFPCSPFKYCPPESLRRVAFLVEDGYQRVKI